MYKKLKIILYVAAGILMLVSVYFFYTTYIMDSSVEVERPSEAIEITTQAQKTPAPTAEPTAVPKPTPGPTAEVSAPAPSPEPTPTPTPEPTPTPSPTPSPTPEPTPTPKIVKPKYNELLERNADVVGWVYIENTKINYPVLYDGTNDYYLDHDIDGNKTVAASIMMDGSNDIGQDDYNILLHGHHMKNGSMFKDVVKYKEKSFFFAPEHNIIYFDTLYDDMIWEVFSVYVIDADNETIYTHFETPEDFVETAKAYYERSIHKIGDIEFTEDDRLLTLSTCSYETKNSRTELHARLIYKNGVKVAEPVTGYAPPNDGFLSGVN